jgi:hypothetical protein
VSISECDYRQLPFDRRMSSGSSGTGEGAYHGGVVLSEGNKEAKEQSKGMCDFVLDDNLDRSMGTS